MKGLTFLAVLFFAATASATTYKCEGSRWSPGLFGLYYKSSRSVRIEFPEEGNVVTALRLASQRNEFGLYDYYLTGVGGCANGDCVLLGVISEVFTANDGSMAITKMTDAGLVNEEEKHYGMVENRVLRFKCKR